jgi:hypothetical protein
MLNWLERQRKPTTNGRIREAVGQISAPKKKPEQTTTSLPLAPQPDDDILPIFGKTWFGSQGVHRIYPEPLPPPVKPLTVSNKDIRSVKNPQKLTSRPNIDFVWSSDGLPWESPVTNEAE